MVLDALDMTIAQRRPQGIIHHSDQGCQYTSIAFAHIAFAQRSREAAVSGAMGSVSGYHDNALCESFFAALERELRFRTRSANQTEPRLAVYDFMEGWYNHRRRRCGVSYLPAAEGQGRYHLIPDTQSPCLSTKAG